jgi:hypothetical protein
VVAVAIATVVVEDANCVIILLKIREPEPSVVVWATERLSLAWSGVPQVVDGERLCAGWEVGGEQLGTLIARTVVVLAIVLLEEHEVDLVCG